MRMEARLRKQEQTSAAVLGREVVFPGLSQRQLPCTTAEYCAWLDTLS